MKTIDKGSITIGSKVIDPEGDIYVVKRINGNEVEMISYDRYWYSILVCRVGSPKWETMFRKRKLGK